MKKFILLLFCLSLIGLSSPVLADDDAAVDDSNWGISPIPQNDSSDNTSNSEKEWNETHDEIIYGLYGSEDSPSFLNRQNMNSNSSSDDGFSIEDR